jgi:hypothetical protein
MYHLKFALVLVRGHAIHISVLICEAMFRCWAGVGQLPSVPVRQSSLVSHKHVLVGTGNYSQLQLVLRACCIAHRTAVAYWQPGDC